jgi:hypothetical protein
VGLDGREGSGVGSLDGDVGVDDLVVMSSGMLCVRDGRKNERRKKKKWACDRGREKTEIELLSENASSNLTSNFSHQIFLVKMVRLLGVVFKSFHQIDSPK